MAALIALTSAYVTQPADAQPRTAASPAAQPLPESATPQSFPPERIEAGRPLFTSQCGFCHGRDATGGAGGSDLTRSLVVAGDVGGSLLAPLIRAGQPALGMPPFPDLSQAHVDAIVAFIHDRKAQAALESGGRRSVEAADLQTGDAQAGRAYFAAACSACHSATGDLAGIAARLSGLTLLRRMLYPGSEGFGGGPRPAAPTVTVTAPDGTSVSGPLAYRDEFVIALTDAAGWYRSWPAQQVSISVDAPLEAHVEQLGRYTDADMHNVLAYLQTLRQE